jgi:outer membrane protein assembly factor BamA
VIEREDDRYVLIVKVKEKMRSFLKVNPSYNLTDDLSLLIMGDFKNVLLPDSRLLSGFTIGKNNRFCLDYVKNFGKEYGFYFHLFPYISEIPLYTYDDDNMKTNSVQALETGETSGIGFFFKRSLILEFYNFTYHKKLYHDIGEEELDDLYFNSLGAGAKLYFETLDNLVFGMRGIKLLSKYSFTGSGDNLKREYSKSFIKFEMLHPLTNWLSVHYRFEYGSHFEEAVPYDPFYVGGLDSFMGLSNYDRSSSIYKINSFSLRLNPYHNLYVEPLINNLKLGNSDNWEINNELEWGGGLMIGYRTPLGPIRTGIGFIEGGKPVGYLNIGYDLDIFEFSRR